MNKQIVRDSYNQIDKTDFEREKSSLYDNVNGSIWEFDSNFNSYSTIFEIVSKCDEISGSRYFLTKELVNNYEQVGNDDLPVLHLERDEGTDYSKNIYTNWRLLSNYDLWNDRFYDGNPININSNINTGIHLYKNIDLWTRKLPNWGFPKTISLISEASTKPNIILYDKGDFVNKNKDSFLALIKKTNAYSEEFSIVEDKFETLINEDKTGAMKLIQEIYINSLESNDNVDNILVGILKIFLSYSYEDLYPEAQMIVSASYSVESTSVKSAVFDVFGHWANKKALELLYKFIEPNEAWLKMKYTSLIDSIKRKYAAH